MAKTDLLDLCPDYYAASAAPRLVELPAIPALALDGGGAPEGDEFQLKTQALYALAYAIKMARKKAGHEFPVAGLEGLWWAEYDVAKLRDPEALWEVPRAAWLWTLRIPQPAFVTAEECAQHGAALVKKGKPALVAEVRLERLSEGRCVQALHRGPYATEPETVARMRAFMREQGLTAHGLHHELYLSDPRRAAPEKVRTILRQPVR